MQKRIAKTIILLTLDFLSAQLGYLEEGEASYYAPSFHGRRTASGEKYDRHALTAAHRTLPFGTYVRVTEKSTGRSVVVRINDRGPFKPTRIIDLSEEAAKELGILARGIGQVRVEVTRLPDETPAPSPPQTEFYDTEGHPIKPYPYGVQVGAFSESANAYVVAKNAWKEIREKVFIWRANAKGKPLYRVIIGSFRQRREAEKLRNKLKSEGWQAFVVHLPL